MNAFQFYKVLELPFGSSLQEVKQAYKKLVKQWHPDLFLNAPPSQQSQAQEKITQINLAYKRLSIKLAKFPGGRPFNFKGTGGTAWNKDDSSRSPGPSASQAETPRENYPKQTINLSNGDVYEGQVLNGKMHGQGTYHFSNGDVYVGNFYMNGRQGKGIYTHSNGAKYVGDFKDGRPHGQGTYYYDNGDRYVGMFVEEEMHGHGTYEYDNGDRYTGQYKKGQPHGLGTYVTATGKQLVGTWENGQLMP